VAQKVVKIEGFCSSLILGDIGTKQLPSSAYAIDGRGHHVEEF